MPSVPTELSCHSEVLPGHGSEKTKALSLLGQVEKVGRPSRQSAYCSSSTNCQSLQMSSEHWSCPGTVLTREESQRVFLLESHGPLRPRACRALSVMSLALPRWQLLCTHLSMHRCLGSGNILTAEPVADTGQS